MVFNSVKVLLVDSSVPQVHLRVTVVPQSVEAVVELLGESSRADRH